MFILFMVRKQWLNHHLCSFFVSNKIKELSERNTVPSWNVSEASSKVCAPKCLIVSCVLLVFFDYILTVPANQSFAKQSHCLRSSIRRFWNILHIDMFFSRLSLVSFVDEVSKKKRFQLHNEIDHVMIKWLRFQSKEIYEYEIHFYKQLNNCFSTNSHYF